MRLKPAIIEKVREARRALLAAGKRDTQDAVIAVLGYGSKTTMVRYWNVTNPHETNPSDDTLSLPLLAANDDRLSVPSLAVCPEPELEEAFTAYLVVVNQLQELLREHRAAYLLAVNRLEELLVDDTAVYQQAYQDRLATT